MIASVSRPASTLSITSRCPGRKRRRRKVRRRSERAFVLFFLTCGAVLQHYLLGGLSTALRRRRAPSLLDPHERVISTVAARDLGAVHRQIHEHHLRGPQRRGEFLQ